MTIQISPYKKVARALFNNGYKPIPVKPNDKIPAYYANGYWCNMKWGRYYNNGIKEKDITKWEEWNNPNIAIILHDIVAIDIDTDNKNVIEISDLFFGDLRAKKKGNKGLTYFLRNNIFEPIKKKILFKKKDKFGYQIIDIITDKTTCVLPPSIHPKGNVYEWESIGLENIHIEELEKIDLNKYEDFIKKLETIDITTYDNIYKKKVSIIDNIFNKYNKLHYDDINIAALISYNIPKWLPNLNLTGTMMQTPQCWRCIPDFRPSNKGTPLRKRKRNLAIHVKGINDFGSGVKYTPTKLISKVLGLSYEDSKEWLKRKIYSK